MYEKITIQHFVALTVFTAARNLNIDRHPNMHRQSATSRIVIIFHPTPFPLHIDLQYLLALHRASKYEKSNSNGGK